jgi:hypothetical protein
LWGAHSSACEFGDLLVMKKVNLCNVITPALREVSGRNLDRRITDDSARQGSFLYR